MTGAILRKELKVLWTSPLPYVLGAGVHVALGVLGWDQITGRGLAVFQPLVPVAGFLLLLAAPVLTARAFAEEARSGSLELLLAVPVPTPRLVAGKYLAHLATLLVLFAPMVFFVLLLLWWGDPDPGPMLTGSIGLVCFAAALTGVGLAASALTSSQPVAAVGAIFAVLLLWFAHAGSDLAAAGGLIGALSVSERLRGFAGGVVDSGDVVFFVSLAAAALAVAMVAVESRRWR